MTTQLDRARADVTDLRMQIRAIATERNAKTAEANGLVTRIKADDRRAIKRAQELDRQIDQLQAEENRLNTRLQATMPALLQAEANSRNARAGLKAAEQRAAAITEIVTYLRPAMDALNPIAHHVQRNTGGRDERMRPTGLYNEHDRQAFDRVFGILSRCNGVLDELEQARAYAAEVGLPEDELESALVLA